MYKYILRLLFFIVIITISSFSNLKAQGGKIKNKFEVGIGYVQIGTSKFDGLLIVNEFDHLFFSRLEGAINFGFGKGISYDGFLPVYASSFFNCNTNLSFIPIKYRDIYKLKFGTGIAYLNWDQVSAASGSHNSEGVFVVDKYNFNTISTFGYNLLIENEINVYKQLNVSLLLYIQHYRNKDSIGGGMLKFGYSF